MKFCKKCQCLTEHYASGGCKVCVKAYAAARRAANPEKNKESSITWAASNPERKKANNKAWNLANPEKVKASKAAWLAANQEYVKVYRAANLQKMIAYNKAYYASNRQKLIEQSRSWRLAHPNKVKEWRESNPEVARINNQNRRARKLANGGTLSKGLAENLFKLQKGKCPCCKQSLGDDYHLDHIVPLALGGSNTDDNMQLLRKQCNQQKHAKHPVDFMQQKGFLL